jgi:hypothetical protein
MFECQLMPQLLSDLEVEARAPDGRGMEFATALVFSCPSERCALDQVVEEAALPQLL